MDFSKIKMVVSDMDGTLLNSNHEVSDRFLKQFQKLKEKNIKFVAASGRQYHSMREKLHAIKDDIIFIAENGGLAKEGEKELLVNPLSKNTQLKLLQKINSVPGTHAMLCGKYTSYFDESSSQFLDMLKEYYSEYKVVENFNEVDDEILKVAVYHDTNAEKYVYPNFKDLENEVKVKVSGRHWVDLNNITAHKGHALQKVMDLYNLQPNQVLAFGDYNNDIEMLSLVDYSFAMANAHASVKKIATYETKSNDAYGVESVLEKLI
jgi:Cof subfamily protein (haloacid dehalogenase superfamily)